MIILIVLLVVIIIFGVSVIKEMKRQENEKREYQRQKKIEAANEYEKLCKSEFLKALHEKMYAEFDNHMKRELEFHLNYYKTKPTSIEKFRYAYEWKIYNSSIWGVYRGFDGEESRAHIRVNDLGYKNLSAVQEELLARALANYSKAWKLDESYSRPKLRYNEEYWDPYIQSYIDKVCAERNIQSLKEI